MILSDTDLERRLEDGDLVVDPITDPAVQIQPASIDLRLGHEFIEFDRANVPFIRPETFDETDDQVTSDIFIEDTDEFILHPGDFVLGSTKEYVEIPDDLVASIEGRSSLGRLAVVVHATAGWVDPGFEGTITLELSNLGNTPVALTPGSRVAQLVLMELLSPSRRPYGIERGSKYQGQQGPQMSKIIDDEEHNNE